MKLIYLLLFSASASLLFSSCTDDTSDSLEPVEGYYFGVECPRLELETFEDCMYEPLDSIGALDLNDENTIADFCQSSCNQIEYVSGYNHGRSASNLSLLKGVRHIKSIELDGMQGLQSLDGLQDLESVGDMLKISYNPKLKSVEALSSLEQVGGPVVIQSNNKLSTLDGFDGLHRADAFSVLYNKRLQDVTALYQLRGLNYFRVTDSPELPTCQAEFIRDQLGLEGESVKIADNGTGSCD